MSGTARVLRSGFLSLFLSLSVSLSLFLSVSFTVKSRCDVADRLSRRARFHV